MQDLPKLRAAANEEERRRLLLSMLDGVYGDGKGLLRVVGIKAQLALPAIFEVAMTRAGSRVRLVKETPSDESLAEGVSTTAASVEEASRCSWWRRGRVELPVQERSAKTSTSVAGVLVLAPPSSTGVVLRGQPTGLWSPLSASRRPHPDLTSPSLHPRGGTPVDVAALSGR